MYPLPARDRVCDSAPRPGVTRSLRWVRLDESEIDLLDAPGILPMRFDNQVAAARLAMVNDIGESSYVDSQVRPHRCVLCFVWIYYTATHTENRVYVYFFLRLVLRLDGCP